MTHTRTANRHARRHGLARPQVVPLEDRVTPTAAYALGNNALISFDTQFPSIALPAVPVTGLATGHQLVGIDFRPQNGMLYGLAFDSAASGVQLYAISQRTALATPIGTAGSLVDAGGNPVPITGTAFGFDFNPTVDRIRVVTDTGLNFRMNPNTGALVDGDTTAAGVQPDGGVNGGTAKVDATAYTNAAPNAKVTTQYTLDASTDKLFIQNPPNTGTQSAPLAVTLDGAALDFTSANGFDIGPDVAVATANAVATGNGFAALTVGGTPGLYAIDLTTGKAALRGPIGPDASVAIRGLALQADPVAGGRSFVSVVAGVTLSRFNSVDPTTATTVALKGLGATEKVVGLDVRPTTGQYYGLVHDVNTLALRVGLVDPQTGDVTAVGSGINLVDANGVAITFALDTGFGFDFNPTVDKLRVVTSTGRNFRVDPGTGSAVDGNFGGGAGSVPGVNPDANLNGTATKGDASAYTNSFAGPSGTTFTTQYTLDSSTDSLYIQNPPNGGNLTNGVAITVNGSPVDFTAVNGFDIPPAVAVQASNAPATGTAFAALTVGGKNGLYAIDLASGAATLKGLIGDGTLPVSGLAASDAPPAARVDLTASGTGAGVAPLVTVSNPDGSVRQANLDPGFGAGFTGGVRVATGDFNGDGVDDLVVGTGPGIATRVRVIDVATQKVLFDASPFEASFTGGVYVAAGDLTGDGRPDVVVTPDEGGGPVVVAYDGTRLGEGAASQVVRFFGIEDTAFRGGARPAVGDVNRDGRADLVVAAGFGGGPRVSVWSGKSLDTTTQAFTAHPFGDFFAFELSLRNGVFITSGDMDGDGFADLVFGGGPGGGPRVRAVSGRELTVSGEQADLFNFFAGDPNTRGGIRVAARPFNSDRFGDLVTGEGPGATSKVSFYNGIDLGSDPEPAPSATATPFGGFTGGVFVG